MQQSSYSGDKMKLSTYGGVVNDNTRPTTRVRFNNQPTTPRNSSIQQSRHAVSNILSQKNSILLCNCTCGCLIHCPYSSQQAVVAAVVVVLLLLLVSYLHPLFVVDVESSSSSSSLLCGKSTNNRPSKYHYYVENLPIEDSSHGMFHY